MLTNGRHCCRPGRLASIFRCKLSSTSSFEPAGDFSSNDEARKVQEALDYCVKIVKERDYENYLAALLMPRMARPRIFSILAFNAEVGTLRHKIKRHSGLSGIHQLTFWREALEVFGQSRKALLPRQPAMVALKAFVDLEDLPLLLNLVDARQQTLGDRPFESVAKLEQNCRQLHGSLLMLLMRALRQASANDYLMDVSEEKLHPAVDSVACALGILTLLRATALLLRDGIVLLPSDLTTLHGVDPDMAYRGPNSLKAVTRDLSQIAANHLLFARAQKGSIPSPLRPALLSAGLRSDHSLVVLRSNDFNLLDARLHKPHPMAGWKLWWRSKCRQF